MSVTIRKLLPLIVVVVLFTLTLICTGIGRSSPTVPRDVRILFVVEMLLAIIAMVVFFFLRKKYCTSPLWINADTSRVYLSNEANATAVTSYLTRNANVIALYVFGAGSIALNAGYIYAEAQCMKFFYRGSDAFRFSDEQVRLLADCVKVAMLFLEIPLLHFVTRITFAHARHLAATASILVLIGANSSLWLFNFMSESELLGLFPTPTNSSLTIEDLQTACFNNNTVMGTFAYGVLDTMMFPFYMVFCIIAIEILYGVYFVSVVRHPIITQMTLPTEQYQNAVQAVTDFTTMQNVCLVPTAFKQTDLDDSEDEREELDGPTYEENERSPLIDHIRPSVQQRRANRPTRPAGQAEGGAQHPGYSIEILHPAPAPVPQDQPLYIRGWAYFLMAFNPLTALIIAVVQAILTAAYLQQKGFIASDYISAEYFYRSCASPLIIFSILCDALPMLFVTAYCCLILSRFLIVRHNSVPLRAVLIVTLIGISLLCCFKMILLAIRLARPEKEMSTDYITVASLSLLETLIYWPQYYLQAMLIYFGQRRKPDVQHALFPTLQGCLSYLAMNNLLRCVAWCFWNVNYNLNRIELDGESGWNDFVLVTTPFFLYFCFVCTFLLLDLKALLKDRAPVRWQLDLAVTSLRPHLR